MTLGETTIVVGSYSGSDDARGLTAFRIEPGRSTVDVMEFPALAADSPSFLVGHPNRRWFYAVTENTESEIIFFGLERDSLRRIQSVPTTAAGACHVAITSDGNHLVVAHYVDGLVTSHRIGPNGAPGPVLDVHRFSGSGPDPERQSMAHAHQVVPFGPELLVADLGTDRIHRLTLDRSGRFVVPGSPIQLPAGSGPRHLVVDSGDRLLVACELTAQVLLLRHDGKEWQVKDAVRTSISDRPCQPSAIRLRADDVFVANRGPDTFSVLDLDRDDDTLTLLTEVPAGGRWPRDLVVRDEQVWVACQRSHLISVFRDVGELDQELGGVDEDLEWRLDFQIETPSPACLVVQPTD
ncbi:lactonase family protein [Naumannella halotolerans]|uniref:6-phosphogluconolactonase (Cycloisomerase 2 family) n=1 Tax=Naumannella halotolerans TaxID=993414 RepID=A0A4R7J695_9ACTN|nr:beta-propeller fold lactonase family protein [Naumannella halotolerans]TDT32890.1 6-phosphogluconolactonase (cycloisomerase 2 family) [Naumannella halotolerans]